VTDGSLSAMPDDVGEYCRRVEDHLTRVNAGHLVRIVGPGFALVRGWAEAGIPLSAVFRGIDQKAERHREGQSRRPLRIEFCEPDVRAVFDQWRRAIGVSAWPPADPAEATEARTPDASAGETGTAAPDAAPGKRPSLAKHLDRAIDRLTRASGRVDVTGPLRDACDELIGALVEIRRAAAGVRGPAREALRDQLPAIDARLSAAVLEHSPMELRRVAEADALADLAPFRARLDPETWQRSVRLTTDRLLRDRLGLPSIDL